MPINKLYELESSEVFTEDITIKEYLTSIGEVNLLQLFRRTRLSINLTVDSVSVLPKSSNEELYESLSEGTKDESEELLNIGGVRYYFSRFCILVVSPESIKSIFLN